MKLSKIIFGSLAAIALLAACSPPARAQEQYESVVLYSSGATLTNVATGTTNLSVTATGTNGVTLTKWDSFALWFDFGTTNPCAGSIDVTYETSYDGSNWSTNKTLSGTGGPNGWFSISATNSGFRQIWGTNITCGSIGYWRIGWLTNQTGAAITNLTIRAYRKPLRQGNYP